MVLSNADSRNRGNAVGRNWENKSYFLNSNLHDEISCLAVILTGRVIRREFLHLYSIHASVDMCWLYITLYFKRISCCEFISLGQLYLATQRRMFQVVIQLSKNATALNRSTRISVVHFSGWSVTSLNGNALLVLSSSTDVLLTSRAAKYITAQFSSSFLFIVLFFVARDLPGARDMVLPLSNQKDKLSGWLTITIVAYQISLVDIMMNNGRR